MPKRRIQFRLITLLAFACISAVLAGWYGNRVRAAAREDWAVTQLANKGACVALYDEGAYIGFGRPSGGLCGTGLRKVVGPSATAVTFSDADIDLLKDVQRIRSIDFTTTQASAACIAKFRAANPRCYVMP